MKKVLLIIHGTEFPDDLIDFVGQLNERSPLLLTGFFVPELMPVQNWAAYSISSAGSPKDTATARNMQSFKEACTRARIEHRERRGTSELTLAEIIKESRYSDLLITGTAASNQNGLDSYPGLGNILRKAECPVMVVPTPFTFPRRVTIACDGSRSSVFAMKQFAYLFPGSGITDISLVHVTEKKTAGLEDMERLKNWATCHFRNVSIHEVPNDAKGYFRSGDNTGTALVVTGSNGRSAVSEWMRRSFSEDLIRNKVLLFSAHC